MTGDGAQVDFVGNEIENRPSGWMAIIDRSAYELIDGATSSRKETSCLPPIHKLPPELFIYIFFSMMKDVPIRQAWSRRPRNRTLGWFMVAHVCRQWRDIAIGAPSLWQNVDLELGPTWIPDMLSRAQTHPVTISMAKCRNFKHGECGELDLLKEHLFHTQRLFLVGEQDELAPTVTSLNAPAPILDHLSLLFSHFKASDEALAPQFFANQTPRLRTLSLTDVPSSWWVKLPTAGLVNLYITYAARVLVEVDSLDFLHFLESITTLKSLYISSHSSSLESWNGHRVIKLPYLTHLQIKCGMCEFLSLTNHIEALPDVSLDFSVVPNLLLPLEVLPGLGTVGICVVLPFVSKHLHSSSPIKTVSLKYEERFRPNGHWGMEVLAWSISCEGDGASTAPDDTPLLRLAQWWVSRGEPDSFRSASVITSRICDTIPLASVTSLSVASTFWTAAHWIDLFGRCGALEHIHAVEDAGAAFILAVSAPSADDLVPHLATVALAHFDLAAREGDDRLADALVSWLRRRRDSRAELRRLHLLSCAVAPDDASALSELVGSIAISRAPVDVEEKNGGTIFKDRSFSLTPFRGRRRGRQVI
ncbi:hypothetical protein BV25DRAFT_1921728 [Artomyces pyxidatus]|uniref:Uncharacterized protein n=1 Tax=Artomyces pyxidatus TaxID=48021 RepID=A0ACB8SH03_9AGAM|nr:hypothetical protein BV25DRAFT_1921728 [Artomyces pyxidatus]